MACAPSLIWVFAVCFMGSYRPYCSSCRQQRLIRLGRCPSWSESSLGAHTILLVLSRCDSIIIFICMCLVSMCLGLSDSSGSKCMLRLKLWWFNVLWGAIKKCLINYYILMCFSLSKVPCVSRVMLSWYFLLFWKYNGAYESNFKPIKLVM